MDHSEKNNLNKATLGGLLISLGIIYGDIGTSPLYVMKAIVGENLGTVPEHVNRALKRHHDWDAAQACPR